MEKHRYVIPRIETSIAQFLAVVAGAAVCPALFLVGHTFALSVTFEPSSKWHAPEVLWCGVRGGLCG
jgi:hypothetical protein